MSAFKDFKIWWEYVLSKYPFLGPIATLGFFLTLTLSILLMFNLIIPEINFFTPLKNFIFFLCFIFFIFFILNTYIVINVSPSSNYKIVIAKAEKLLYKHRPRIEKKLQPLIWETQRTKNPQELSRFISDYEKLLSAEKNYIELGIQNDKINAQIQENRNLILELETKLSL